MSKKKWVLLVILAVLAFGYIKLFYKTYTVQAVAKSADCILVLDVKRITNTIIWQFITTPGQWKASSGSSKSKPGVNWKDMVELPDYVMPFHVKDQPVNTWYLVLTVKDENNFNTG